MVLIQLLLPTSGAAGGDSLAPLAETRRELAERFNGLTAYLRSPATGGVCRESQRVGLQCDGAIRDSQRDDPRQSR